MSIIIDANASFEYTSRGYTSQFREEGTMVVFEAVKYLLKPKIFYRDIKHATCCLDADRTYCLCLWFRDRGCNDSAIMEIQV